VRCFVQHRLQDGRTAERQRFASKRADALTTLVTRGEPDVAAKGTVSIERLARPHSMIRFFTCPTKPTQPDAGAVRLSLHNVLLVALNVRYEVSSYPNVFHDRFLAALCENW